MIDNKPGAFISLDGLDGTGKSTQCRLLATGLRQRGLTVTTCKDPGSTVVGDAIRTMLLHHRGELALPCEAFLFMASRAQLVQDVIRPALQRGEVVICDRFLLANVVYQGHAGGLDPAFLWQCGLVATGGLEPDLTIVLDLPIDVASARRQRPADRMENRDAAFHQRVRDGFLAEARRRPERICVIDAAADVDSVSAQIRQEVARVVGAHSGT